MRISIDMRTVISLLIVLFLVSILNPTTSDAQDSPVYMYWTVHFPGKIQRANLDGSNVQDLVTGLVYPEEIAVDIVGGKMYWTDRDTDKIQRANLNGTDIEDLVTTGSPGLSGITIDVVGGKMYWTDHETAKIQRANLNGTNVEDLVTTGLILPDSIVLDIAAGKMYWTDQETAKIQRANLNGTNVEDLVTTGLILPVGIALDAVAGKMYWAEHGGGNLRSPDHNAAKIRCANLDGSDIQELVNMRAGRPHEIVLDVANGKMYWTDWVSNKIRRANLDGSSVEEIVRGSGGILGLALGIPDSSGGLRFSPNVIADQYFTVDILVGLTLPIAVGGTAPYTYSLSALPAGLYFDHATRQIRGTPTTVVSAHPVTYTVRDATGSTASLDFTITIQNTALGANLYMYWLDWDAGKIQRANLDGTNIEDLVTTGRYPSDIALDLVGGKVYWTGGRGTAAIQRANLDGTNIEDLIPIISRPDGIALDIGSRKMYWTSHSGKIQRANLDGTNIEDLVTTGLSRPDDMALDLAGGKMYWTDWGTDKIQRANLDGTNIEDLVTTGLSGSSGIAVDVIGGKMYWTDERSNKIQRANLDGTNIEDLVTTGLSRPEDIELDVASGKMYWTNPGRSKIQCANLDGSHVEDLVTTGLSSPVGIALGIPQTPLGDGLRFSPNTISDQTFTVGTDVSLTLPIATGGTPPYLYTLAPTLPAGLYFDPIANGPGYIGGTPTAALPATPFTYTATDANGASAALTFTITVEADGLNLDVNGDGRVDVLDLVWVAVSYGMRGAALPADINADGVVNVTDLVAVAEGIDAGAALPAKIAEELLFAAEAAAAELEGVAGAPVIGFNTPRQVAASGINAYGNVAAALSDARSLVGGDVRLGKWMPLLEEFLQLLAEMGAIPESTTLLPNYPNPFNPETWIPYHLATDAEVTLTVYDVRGSMVRELRFGHQPAGVYESRGRAAYWDGKNQLGEKVASGLYFYTLTAGEFNATRKLLIQK